MVSTTMQFIWILQEKILLQNLYNSNTENYHSKCTIHHLLLPCLIIFFAYVT
jgi:hypothetical protein